ncbi:DUF4474 domain-containing protein [Clostridium manihotivorum]|uniref:DUF4474 domain-containing protein n=1 Tax=Clostridium manihotivorum TaxID=2320868 RepID=UPI0013E3A09E|nr:DUF4474 domain-containing protein [Clostridium manihotivorum]
MDQMVLTTQMWLNNTYSENPAYQPVKTDGITGWPTINALITALQIELKIQSPNGNFGPATRSAFKNLSIYSQPTASLSDAEIKSLQNQIRIVQGALYCKGYNPTAISGNFGSNTDKAIKELQADAGIAQTGIVDSTLMRALLTMDAFKLLNYGSYQGDENIREIQQVINRKYISNKTFESDLGLIPCDGLYGRSMNKALLYALQIEEGINPPNGVFGPTTSKLCPTLSKGQSNNFVLILQYILYCNGYDPTSFTGYFGDNTEAAIRRFQEFSCLPVTGIAGIQTWKSLLISCGDNTRKGTACDCSTTITPQIASTLKSNGYTVVGRYLTGKYALTYNETLTIINAGLSIIPLFEVGGYKLEYFNSDQGKSDAEAAIDAAKKIGMLQDTIIYFAVDFDALDGDIDTSILPYFKEINDVFDDYNNFYKVGIYAPRNVCSRVAKAGYSCSSFACDMSTGFSGNLGYTLPRDWAFDQISTISIGSGSGLIEIDNNISSGRNSGASTINNNCITPWTPNSSLATIVSAFGFLYDPLQDIIYSEMYPAIQRRAGYCKMYDDSAAVIISAIIDCEPIYFSYDNKDWMIELWKGQYGIETGAEIGVYNRYQGKEYPEDIVVGKFFACVTDEERLTMSFVLKRNGVKIIERGPEVHWWLTGFKWGEFTNDPSTDLTMDITIKLKNSDMMHAFLGGLQNSGYIMPDVDISANTNFAGPVIWYDSTVTFTFDVPKSKQPQSRIDDFNSTQAFNNTLVEEYNLLKKVLGVNSNDPNLIDYALVEKLSSEAQDSYNRIVTWFNSIQSMYDKVIKSQT